MTSTPQFTRVFPEAKFASRFGRASERVDDHRRFHNADANDGGGHPV